MLQKTLKFLQETKIFYIATVDNGKPRVRPFGLVVEHDGKLYFGTGNTKAVYRQMQNTPYVEISATSADMTWIRLFGKVVFDDNLDVKKKMLQIMPTLIDIYKGGAEDPEFATFYLTDAEVVFQNMTDSVKPQAQRL